MDYVKIVKEGFAWWNNLEVWGWCIGAQIAELAVFGVLALVAIAMFGGGVISAFLTGDISKIGSAIAGIVALYFLYMLAGIAIALVLSGKLVSIAMKRAGILGREFNSGSVLRYLGLGVLEAVITIAALIAMGIVWVAAILGASALSSVPVLPTLGLLAAVLVSSVAFIWLCLRISMGCIFFWKKEGDCKALAT